MAFKVIAVLCSLLHLSGNIQKNSTDHTNILTYIDPKINQKFVLLQLKNNVASSMDMDLVCDHAV